MRLMFRTYRGALPPGPAWQRLNLLFEKPSSFTWKASRQMVFPFLSLVATLNTSTFPLELQASDLKTTNSFLTPPTPTENPTLLLGAQLSYLRSES